MTDMDKLMDRADRHSKLHDIGPFIKWEDLEENEWYHLPPLVYSERMDVKITMKAANFLRISVKGKDYSQTILKSDVVANFFVKIQNR